MSGVADGAMPELKPSPIKPRRNAWHNPRSFFATPLDAFLTLLTLLAISVLLFFAVRWAIVNSVWFSDTPDACAGASGACWAVVTSRWRILFLGVYPYSEQWRAITVLLLFIGAAVLSITLGRMHARVLIGLWVATLAAALVLLGGGIFGLRTVPSDQWSGLPLTIVIFLCSVALGFPMSIILAVARTGSLVSARLVSAFMIECIRPLPLVTVLFFADLVLPLVIPEWLNPGKAARITLSMALFYACYQAEVIRAGFSAIPQGQFEAARSLGLKSVLTMRLIVLPQALRVTAPATINLLVVVLKDTSLIITVGLFDFLAAANATFTGNAWEPYFDEIYIIIALVYLVMTLVLAKLGQRYAG